MPDLDGVEPVGGFAGGAVGDCFLALGVDVSRAVVPEADLVEVLEGGGGLDALEGGDEAVVGVRVRDVGDVGEGLGVEAFGVCLGDVLVGCSWSQFNHGSDAVP